LKKQIVVRFPKVLGHYAGAVATHVNGGRNFERACRGIRQLHEHLERDAVFRAAQKGSVHERDPAKLYFLGKMKAGPLSPPFIRQLAPRVNST
jgi:hypothetical protein